MIDCLSLTNDYLCQSLLNLLKMSNLYLLEKIFLNFKKKKQNQKVVQKKNKLKNQKN